VGSWKKLRPRSVARVRGFEDILKRVATVPPLKHASAMLPVFIMAAASLQCVFL